MKKKLFVLFGILLGAFLFVFTFSAKTYAEEIPNEDETPIQEVLDEEPKQEEQEEQPKEEEVIEQKEEEVISDADKEKIKQIVEFLSKLNKDELLDLLKNAKNWFIGIGIVGALSILTAIIGLVAAIVKLHNEKIRNSQLSEKNKEEAIKSANNVKDMIDERTNEIKMLLLDFTNGLSDEDKKQVESNVESVKTQIIKMIQKENQE